MSCDDIPSSGLIGKWQLKTVDKSGVVVTSVDTIWYNFQSESVFSAQVYVPQKDTVLSVVGMRTQSDNIITIELTDWAYLDYFDWNGVKRSFAIENVGKKNLILCSEEGYRYSFIKF